VEEEEGGEAESVFRFQDLKPTSSQIKSRGHIMLMQWPLMVQVIGHPSSATNAPGKKPYEHPAFSTPQVNPFCLKPCSISMLS